MTAGTSPASEGPLQHVTMSTGHTTQPHIKSRIRTLCHRGRHHVCSGLYGHAKSVSEPENYRRPLLDLRLQQLGRLLAVEEDGVRLEEAEDLLDQPGLVQSARVVYDRVTQTWDKTPLFTLKFDH